MALTFDTIIEHVNMSVKDADGHLTKIHPVTSANVTLVDVTDPALANHTAETTVQKAITGLNARVDAMGTPDQFEKVITAESDITLPTHKGHYFVIGTAGTYYGHVLDKDDRLYVYKEVAAGGTPTTSDFQATEGNRLIPNELFDAMPNVDDIAGIAIKGNVFVAVDPSTL